MQDERKRFLAQCRKMMQEVEEGKASVESAAYALIGAIIASEGLLAYPEIDSLFGVLAEADLPRETSYAQPIGHWREDVADRLKDEEWARVVEAIQRAEQICSG